MAYLHSNHCGIVLLVARGLKQFGYEFNSSFWKWLKFCKNDESEIQIQFIFRKSEKLQLKLHPIISSVWKAE